MPEPPSDEPSSKPSRIEVRYEHDDREFSPGERAAIRQFMLGLSLEDIKNIKRLSVSHDRLAWAGSTIGLWLKWIFWIATGVVSIKVAINSFYQGSLFKLGMIVPVSGATMRPSTHKATFQRNLIPGFVCVAIFAPVLWMAIDRQVPYVRTNGVITPANPAPGDFVEVKWTVVQTRICRPEPARNISRHVITSSGLIIDYEPVSGVMGTVEAPKEETLVRAFQLPISTDPGPAKYRSEACFACNPLQILWPVCVEGPDVQFNVAEPREQK